MQPVRSHDMECEVVLTQFTKKEESLTTKLKTGKSLTLT